MAIAFVVLIVLSAVAVLFFLGHAEDDRPAVRRAARIGAAAVVLCTLFLLIAGLGLAVSSGVLAVVLIALVAVTIALGVRVRRSA